MNTKWLNEKENLEFLKKIYLMKKLEEDMDVLELILRSRQGRLELNYLKEE